MPPTVTTQVPLEVQVACIRREIRHRKSLYPKLVEQGRMLEATAARELVAMEAVKRTLMALLEAQQGELFR